jgi:hypothetical protein
VGVLHRDLFLAVQAGQPTARVGEAMVPTGCIEREVEERVQAAIDRLDLDGSVLPETVCAASDTGEPTIMGEGNAGPSPSERSGSGVRPLARHLRLQAPRPSRAKPPTSSTSGGGTSMGCSMKK